MIYFSKSELSGDTVEQERLQFSCASLNLVHFIASQLKVAVPFTKERRNSECDIHEGCKLDGPEHQGFNLIYKVTRYKLREVMSS